jgi:hypothetical protein
MRLRLEKAGKDYSCFAEIRQTLLSVRPVA